VVLAEPKTGGGSIGLVKKQALNAYINGRRSAESWRQKSYPPRKKVEENGQRKNVDFLRNRKVFRQPDDEQPFRGFPKRNRFNLSLPVRDGETTVMIRNIPSKYTYVFCQYPLRIPSFSFNEPFVYGKPCNHSLKLVIA